MPEENISNSLKQLRDAVDQLSSELERSQAGFHELDVGQEKIKELLTNEYAEAIAARFERSESLLRELDARTRALSERFEIELEEMSRKLMEQQKRTEEEDKISRALQRISGETVSIDSNILHELREKSR